jgi:type IV pilus assembly protein PilC
MPKFQYTARTRDGKLETDTIETSSLESAISVLQNQQLIVIKIEPFGKTSGFNLTGIYQLVQAFLNRVKTQDVVLFTKQLATLIQAKVPLVQSLRVMAKQVTNPAFSIIITDVANEVDAGSVFSRALAKYPKVFGNFYVQMVRSGEISGRLEETLLYLADYINRQYMLNSKAKGAMIYPAFIVAAFIIISVLMLVFVIPNITSILIESGQQLPIMTRLLIFSAEFTKTWGIVVFVILVVAVFFVTNSIKKSPTWRMAYDGLKLKIPVFGELLKKIYLARFSETLATLSSAGIAISQSLELTADVVGNAVYRKIILEANDSVRKGGNISSVFAGYPEILPMVTQMIAIGEQTGKLDSILKQVTAFFTDEVNRAFDNIVNLIEPLLIMFLGGGVGILVAAVLLPIYNLVNAF